MVLLVNAAENDSFEKAIGNEINSQPVSESSETISNPDAEGNPLSNVEIEKNKPVTASFGVYLQIVG